LNPFYRLSDIKYCKKRPRQIKFPVFIVLLTKYGIFSRVPPDYSAQGCGQDLESPKDQKSGCRRKNSARNSKLEAFPPPTHNQALSGENLQQVLEALTGRDQMIKNQTYLNFLPN